MTVLILAAIVNVEHLVRASGYPLLFVLVMGECSGIPIPGETALIAAAVLAGGHTLSIEAVIALAAAGAIVGDNIGYLIGRKGGRWVLERPGAFHYQRLQVLATGEPFFVRHGPKAVFFGRFILGLRVWASWLAGATHMPWRSFLLWNALGGMSWALIIGTAAYLLGKSASNVVETFGLFGLAAVVVAVGAFLFWRRRQRHQRRPGRDGRGDDAPVPDVRSERPAPCGPNAASTGPEDASQHAHEDGGAAVTTPHRERSAGPPHRGAAGG